MEMRTNLQPKARAIDFPSEVFPNAWRPQEAQYRALHAGLKFFHRQVIENAFLHPFEVVVILVKNDLPFAMSISSVPEYFPHGREIIHSRYVRATIYSADAGGHLGQPLQLAIAFLASLSRHAGLFDLLAKLVNFGLPVFGFAQFLMNRLELLAQQVGPAGSGSLVPALVLESCCAVPVPRSSFDSSRIKVSEPSPYVGGFKQFLAKQRGQRRQIRRDEIGEPYRIVNIQGCSLQVIGKLR